MCVCTLPGFDAFSSYPVVYCVIPLFIEMRSTLICDVVLCSQTAIPAD